MSDPNIAEKYYGKLKAQGEETIADFVWQQAETIKQLRSERDDLAHQVKALKAWSALTHAELLAEGIDHPYGSPKFALAHIQAEAVEKAIQYASPSCYSLAGLGNMLSEATLYRYANQLRQQADKG